MYNYPLSFSHGKLPEILRISTLPKTSLRADANHGVFPFPLFKEILKNINVSEQIGMTATRHLYISRAEV